MAQSADSAANAERMERARRDAANPLRMIIEASQVKKGGKPADAAAAPAAPAVSAPVATARSAVNRAATVTPPSGGVTERVQPLPQLASPSQAQASPPTAQAGPPAQATPATAQTSSASPSPPVNSGVTASVAAPSVVTAAPAPTTAAASPAPAPATTADEQAVASASPLAAAPAARAVEAPLKLVRYIEPELPQRVRTRLKPNSEVTVVFKVNVDGSVSDLDIRATSNKMLDPIVLEAVRQWRYDPVPESRVHAVQLVFNLDN
ncbi:TonB family protein [Aquabacterium sp.]|uniref:TonB family protein n=1 Tax=Aquabacterium sp. TaxID=1872578 RepID=UPI002D0B7E72|nr:TonB family protein [Aquabacterium sp.]HSW03295.1 TonB family protein [Aquabacterium sp.]